MQTTSLLVKWRQGGFKAEDQKLTGRTSFMQRNTEFLHSLAAGGWTLEMPHQVIRESGHIVLIADTVCTTRFRAKQKIPHSLSSQQQHGDCAYYPAREIRYLPPRQEETEAGRSSGRDCRKITDWILDSK